MPIYEYQCYNCDHKIECIQKINDDPLLTCPQCDTDGLRKLVSRASFRLKGTGWYATDFRDKSRRPGGDKETEKETAVTSGDDSKPADKPETKPADSSSTDKKEAGTSA